MGEGYQRLAAWNRAMELVEEVYELAARLPGLDRYELASQMRRAAVSVPSNLAEGYGRAHRTEYAHHVGIANGSLYELETQLLIVVEAGYLERDATAALLRALEEPAKPLQVHPASS